MDKNNKHFGDADRTAENVNGARTSDSFTTYSKLQNPKLKFSLKKVSLYMILTSLLLASAYIFASTIKTAYFAPPAAETENDNINIIKTSYQNNDTLKVEPVTEELSGLFGIPVGVKIIEINSSNAMFNGLRINDIIVDVSGTPVQSIEDMDTLVNRLSEEPFVTYTIYRNGVYKTVDPFNDSVE